MGILTSCSSLALPKSVLQRLEQFPLLSLLDYRDFQQIICFGSETMSQGGYNTKRSIKGNDINEKILIREGIHRRKCFKQEPLVLAFLRCELNLILLT